jgi:hypothetical protein
MPGNDLTEAIRQFLAGYDAAFQTFEGPKIAPFYHAPCVTVRGDGSVHALQTQSEIKQMKYRSSPSLASKRVGRDRPSSAMRSTW